MGGFATWRKLTGRDRLRLASCTLGLAGIHASLAVFGYVRTRKWVEAATSRPTHGVTAEQLADSIALARLARIAGRRGIVDATCLRQSLLLHGWLRLRGLRTSLQLGVKEHPAGFRAHAWVELEGTRLSPSDEGYSVLASARQ